MKKEIKPLLLGKLKNGELIDIVSYLTDQLSKVMGDRDELRKLIDATEETAHKLVREVRGLRSWREKKLEVERRKKEKIAKK